ncbi:MAG: Flp family type IVb pilin [Anaerolineales bacterium]|nr:Flp family type IVb pilin [Anaerolineales bacterium]
MFDLIKAWLPKDEKGQDLSEYALLIGLLALVVMIAVRVLGVNLTGVFNNIALEVSTWF